MMKRIHFDQRSWRGDTQDDDDDGFPSGKNRAVLEVESDSMIPIEIMEIVHSAIRDFDTPENIALDIRNKLSTLLGVQ